jgi:hypothetical protein
MNELEEKVDYFFRYNRLGPKIIEYSGFMSETIYPSNFNTWFETFVRDMNITDEDFVLKLKVHMQSLIIDAIFSDYFVTESFEVAVKMQFIHNQISDVKLYNFKCIYRKLTK